MNKRSLPCICTALLMVSLTGCSRQQEVAGVAQDGKYILVTDFLDRQVNVQDGVKHIGSLFAVASHVIAMLGEADAVVTVPQGNKRDLLFCEMYPAIRKARVVKGGNTVNIEELMIPPRPDLLFANPEVVHDQAQMNRIEKLHVPIITLAYSDMQQQMKMVELVGKVLGREKEARAYTDYFRNVIERVAAGVAGIPEAERKTLYHAINELLRTDQHGTLSADWIDHAGVRNVAFDGTTSNGFTIAKNYLSIEELFKHNPDVIIINGGGVLDYIEDSPQLHNLKAYRDGNIHLLPLGVTRWGHPYSIETPLALLWTAKTVYPERFGDVDMEAETRRFYRDFFSYELSDTQLKKILSGRGYKEIKGSGR